MSMEDWAKKLDAFLQFNESPHKLPKHSLKVNLRNIVSFKTDCFSLILTDIIRVIYLILIIQKNKSNC